MGGALRGGASVARPHQARRNPARPRPVRVSGAGLLPFVPLCARGHTCVRPCGCARPCVGAPTGTRSPVPRAQRGEASWPRQVGRTGRGGRATSGRPERGLACPWRADRHARRQIGRLGHSVSPRGRFGAAPSARVLRCSPVPLAYRAPGQGCGRARVRVGVGVRARGRAGAVQGQRGRVIHPAPVPRAPGYTVPLDRVCVRLRVRVCVCARACARVAALWRRALAPVYQGHGAAVYGRFLDFIRL
jgi:hypothetical protein